MIERWKNIKGYEGFYKISSLGVVKSVDRSVVDSIGRKRFYPGKQLNFNLDSRGYPSVCLCKKSAQKTTSMHRLMAIHFIENPHKKPHVNHKDGNKENFNLSNLEWCTAKENYDHSVLNGLQGYSATPVQKFDLEGNFIKEYSSQKSAEKDTGICRKQINTCARGLQKTAHGYIWKYLNK